jgi:hypothetical protein
VWSHGNYEGIDMIIETLGIILAAFLIAWGASVIDQTPHEAYFTYPGSQVIDEARGTR